MTPQEYSSLEDAFFKAAAKGDVEQMKPFLRDMLTQNDTFKEGFAHKREGAQEKYGLKLLLTATYMMPEENIPALLEYAVTVAPAKTMEVVTDYARDFRLKPGR